MSNTFPALDKYLLTYGTICTSWYTQRNNRPDSSIGQVAIRCKYPQTRLNAIILAMSIIGLLVVLAQRYLITGTRLS